MANLRDRVKTATPDTGTSGYINCGPAVPGFRNFNTAYSNTDAANITYVIEDGTAWETGVGTYSAAGDSLNRASVVASSNGGNRINLSGNATLAVTFLSRDNVADWPYLEVFSDTFAANDLSGYFPTMTFNRRAAVKDTTGTWNPNDGNDATWTLTQDGVYDCLFKFRLGDGLPSGVSYGIGVGEGNGDGPNFSWFESGSAQRKGAIYRRVSAFSAGQKLRAFSYVDYPANQTSITFAALTIMRVR